MHILVINPGSTSTKIAVYQDATPTVSYTHLTLPTIYSV